MSYVTYILQCADDSFYVGCTNNLKKRLQQHNNSKWGAHYTKIRRPVVLKYSERFRILKEARRREAEIKGWRREKKLSLIKFGKPITPSPTAKNMDKTYCIFGDSVTQAAYVKVGWVGLLRQYLEDKYKDVFVNVFDLGIGGNTTGDILKRFNSEALSRNPSSIIFAVGINDTNYNNLIEFRTNLEKLVELAKVFTPNITFVGLVLGNWTSDELFSQERTTNYNQIIKEVAVSKECRFIQLQDKLDPKDFQDGLHPNEEGHRKMFQVIKKYF